MGVLSQLIEQGASVNSLDSTMGGRRPLNTAVQSSNQRSAQLLIDNGAIVNLSDENGQTPLHLAARAGDCAMMAFLVERAGARVDFYSYLDKVDCSSCGGEDGGAESLMVNALNVALEYNRVDCVRYLLQHGASANYPHFLGWFLPVEKNARYVCMSFMHRQ